MTKDTTVADRDSAQLEALGYDSKFDRSMSLWANFALGFTYLSPVVGVYTVFAFAVATGAVRAMFWSYFVRRPRTAPGRSRVRRDRLSVFHRGRSLSVGPAASREALGVDGWLGLLVGVVYHHRRRGRGRISLRG